MKRTTSKTHSAAAKPRGTSRQVEKSPGCIPLKQAYARAKSMNPKTWTEIEDVFLRAMEGFDKNVADAVANMGDLQNGKGDFFNDLLALILEGCAGVVLYSRGEVPGLVFPKHHLDVTYPASGATTFILEAKAVGTPKHPGSPKQRELGRAGSADLDKRIKEIGFKTIDLKAEYARILAARGESPNVIAGDLTNWLRSVKPRSYVFFAARVISDKDRERVIAMARLAGLVSDAVGVFCYRPVSAEQPTLYRAEPVPPDVSLDRVLFRACQELSAMKSLPPVEAPGPSPSQVAQVPEGPDT